MIESDEDELMQGKILHKLGRSRKYGARHTAIENLYHYFPRHVRNQAKKTVEKLIHKRFLIKKITGYGVHVSVNYVHDNRREIERLVDKYLLRNKKAQFTLFT